MSLVDRIIKDGIVVIIRTRHPESLPELVRCLVEGGMAHIEITYDTPNTSGWISKLLQEHGDRLKMGAGTLLDVADAQEVIKAGASFLVCPHTDLEIIRLAKRYSRVVMPGTFTPTEMMQAWQAGADFVKVFPGHIVGPEFIRAVRGPLPHIRMIPTGKLDEQNIPAFFEAGVCAVGLGSCLFNDALLGQGDFDTIRRNVEKYRKLVDGIVGS